jgi:hypothetical protein
LLRCERFAVQRGPEASRFLAFPSKRTKSAESCTYPDPPGAANCQGKTLSALARARKRMLERTWIFFALWRMYNIEWRVVVVTGPKKWTKEGKERGGAKRHLNQSISAIVMYNVRLITGSSRGLGRVLTEVVLEAGHRVATSARQAEQLSDLRATHKNRLLTAAPLYTIVYQNR